MTGVPAGNAARALQVGDTMYGWCVWPPGQAVGGRCCDAMAVTNETDNAIETLHTDDGVELATRRHGAVDAPVALVLAHGFTMTSASHRLTALAGGLADAGRAVYTFDFRGHGRSSGVSTLGDLEILDLDAVVRLARSHHHDKIVVAGASMGGFVALRHAALIGGEDAVVAISTPATWGVSRRLRARALFLATRNRVGRRLLLARGTRVIDHMTDVPLSPSALAGEITIPVAVVHGDRDRYVPTDDAVLLHEQLGGPKRLVIVPGFGHAETAFSPAFASLLDSLLDDLLGEPHAGGARETSALP